MNALIAHVKYHDSSDRYTSMNNEQISEMPVEVSLKQKYSSSQPVVLPIFPDGGTSLCLAGPNLLQSLNINPKNLINCDKIVTGVGGSKLSCQGWTTSKPVFICKKVELGETNHKLTTHITFQIKLSV